MKRRYTHIKEMEVRLVELRRLGKPRQEIAEEMGLTNRQVKDWIRRHNKRISENMSAIPKQRGRKPTVTLAEYKYENKRLKMENELLRDFLHLAGRRRGQV
jgi:predicted transcriptional regulator